MSKPTKGNRTGRPAPQAYKAILAGVSTLLVAVALIFGTIYSFTWHGVTTENIIITILCAIGAAGCLGMSYVFFWGTYKARNSRR